MSCLREQSENRATTSASYTFINSMQVRGLILIGGTYSSRPWLLERILSDRSDRRVSSVSGVPPEAGVRSWLTCAKESLSRRALSAISKEPTKRFIKQRTMASSMGHTEDPNL